MPEGLGTFHPALVGAAEEDGGDRRDRLHRLAQDCIRSVEVVEYEELGMEAVWKIEVEDFPAFIVVDDKGNDFFTDPSGAVTVPLSSLTGSGIRVRSAQ